MHVSDGNLTFLQAFYIYEYIITLDREVELFWKAPVSWAKIVYFVNRYLTFTEKILTLLLWLPHMSPKVRSYGKVRMYAGI